MAWTLLGVWGPFEYWLAPDGENVHRRKVNVLNYCETGRRERAGFPVGARWDSSLAHFQRFVAGTLPV